MVKMDKYTVSLTKCQGMRPLLAENHKMGRLPKRTDNSDDHRSRPGTVDSIKGTGATSTATSG